MTAQPQPQPQPQPTPDDVVRWKLAYEQQFAEMRERHAKEIAESKLLDNMSACNSWLLNYLNVNGLQNCKTPSGVTFYKITKTSLTLDPDGGRDLFLQNIFLAALKRALDELEKGNDEVAALHEFVATPEMSLLDARPLKSEVLPWLEKNQAGPESLGCRISQHVELGFRKT
jgi:hypothetical protein